ncbi:MAG: hypothetical protein Q8R45_00065 [Brevundimonas sp.]|uniref:hypothetical protein n=1 Tax=Brevundimonas sp. TaxID=1871086 RepID=UPI0027368E68|nr:hypothetical protein [Brevundimonas sp.]MDP3655350.1 hypothetical protein [Brevundimonas sp.]
MKLTDAVAVLAALGIAGCQPAPVVVAADEPAPDGPQTTAAFGVAFDHAAGLETRSCDGDMPRCTILFDPAAEEFMRDLLTVQVRNGSLETVAAAEAGFVRNAEGRLMTTYGRFEPVAVEPFEVNGKSGLRAVVTCGVSHPETGFHAAAGECLWAVVSDGAQSVVISSSGFGNGLEAAETAVHSIRLTSN